MSSPLLLTTQERDRFASWLEREIETGEGMIQQMKKIPKMLPLIDKQERETAAYLTVARALRSTEDTSKSNFDDSVADDGCWVKPYSEEKQ